MTPLTVCCFKWKTPHYRSIFGPETVNVLRAMVRRHYPKPHEFVCITDDPTGIDRDIRIVPLWKDFASLVSPYGRHQPSCYRRLKLFSPEAGTLIGPRFISIDLDTVIVGDLRPIFDRPEDFIIWGETDPRSHYNGSMFMLTAGARRRVWDEFDPVRSPQQAKAAGNFGSDQGYLSWKLGPGETKWTLVDGVYSYRIHIQKNHDVLPPDARIVMFHGGTDPWSTRAQDIPWIRRHYQRQVAA